MNKTKLLLVFIAVSLLFLNRDTVLVVAQAAVMVIMSKMAIRDIEFHGKIIDQHGDPVSDVTVDYLGSRTIYASGSGPGTVLSGVDGKVTVDDCTGQLQPDSSLNELDNPPPEIIESMILLLQSDCCYASAGLLTALRKYGAQARRYKYTLLKLRQDVESNANNVSDPET